MNSKGSSILTWAFWGIVIGVAVTCFRIGDDVSVHYLAGQFFGAAFGGAVIASVVGGLFKLIFR